MRISAKRRTNRIMGCICILLLMLPLAAFAANKVVVVPLFESAGGPPAPVPKTGQTTSYAPGDDGDLERGVVAPTPRFTDNGNGTVTDYLTGLIWLKKGNCIQFYVGDTATANTRTWDKAIEAANKLSGTKAGLYCGLTDGSRPGDWRLPNRNELFSLIDFEEVYAYPPGCPLADLTEAHYWSSTTRSGSPEQAWCVNFLWGFADYYSKSDYNAVRAVRGGQ